MSVEILKPLESDEAALQQQPVRWRELLVVVLLVALSDVTIYRGHGYAGCALLFGIAPLLLLIGAHPRRKNVSGLVAVGILQALLVVKLVWCGSQLQLAAAAVLLAAFAVALSGLVPYILELAVFPSRMMIGGMLASAQYCRMISRPSWRITRGRWLSVVLPLVALIAFSLLFILANPDLLASFGHRLGQWLTSFRRWLIDFSPRPTEMLFWMAIAWIAAGMLRPMASRPLFEELAAGDKHAAAAPSPAPLYAACRNTLVTVIALFAIYLIFEFKTLWFRVFPAGFYYSGYAHQGAAWLTVALALATVILSLVFRNAILADPRIRSLKRLAWIWSIENVLLAIAVYHRLYIYVGFNGMTRMRIVGLFGVTSVLVGFLLVVWKIARRRTFVWLMRRHLWTVALAIYVFALTPVDTIVVAYNVRRILDGDLAPSVQITVHPISAEGILLLRPLLDCENATIREGTKALLAQRDAQAEAVCTQQQADGWTAFQCADRLVRSRLRAQRHRWAEYRDMRRQSRVWQQFADYAYQWY